MKVPLASSDYSFKITLSLSLARQILSYMLSLRILAIRL